MKKLLILAILPFALAACGNRNAKKNTESQAMTAEQGQVSAPDMHNSNIALDYGGTYKGVIPCADCEGIEVEITIDYGGNYTKKMTYLGKKRNNVFTSSGKYTWNDLGTKITLGQEKEPDIYLVGENRLFMLDSDGNRITGSLSDKYILEQTDKTYYKAQ